ncbi:MAG TPA: hypothetical protein VGF25_04445 [Thermoleophilaceae bacterium]
MTDCASQPATPCSSDSQRAISACRRSLAPHSSSRSNHSSQPRPVRRRIASSDIVSVGPSPAFGSSTPSSAERAAV